MNRKFFLHNSIVTAAGILNMPLVSLAKTSIPFTDPLPAGKGLKRSEI